MSYLHVALLSSTLLASTLIAAPVAAQSAVSSQVTPDGGDVAEQNQKPDDIVVTATRSTLPVSALPVTVEVIGPETFVDQVAISGSTIDAVSSLVPSFSPTRQKLTGAGESLRGRAPLFTINGVPQSTPIRDGSRDGYTIDPFFIDRIELISGPMHCRASARRAES